MKLTSKKHFFIIFLIASLIISCVIVYFISVNSHPYTLKIDNKIPTNEKKTSYFYEDFDNDNLSEQIRLMKPADITNDYLQLFNSNLTLIDQINLFSRTNLSWIYFEDYLGDSEKELFVFSQLKDSLFITVYSIEHKDYLHYRQKILVKPDSAKNDFWDIALIPIGISDKRDQFFFYIWGGYAIYPRGVFSYSFDDKSLSNRFTTGAPPVTIDYTDITNDNSNEIIIAGAASGNINPPVGYHDNTKWLFVLDQQLKPIFTPKNFGTYSGQSQCFILNRNNDKYLFYAFLKQEKDEYVYQPFLFNNKGEIVDSLKWIPKFPSQYYQSTKNRNGIIYTSDLSNNLVKIDIANKSVSINEKVSDYVYNGISFIDDFPFSNSDTFLTARTPDKLLIINHDLEIVAISQLEEYINYRNEFYTIKKNGSSFSQLALIGSEKNILYSLIENKIITYLQYLFFIILIVLYTLFVLTHKIVHYFSTYIKYFSYSLNKSLKSVALFTFNGNLFFANSNLKKFLNLNNQLSTLRNYEKIFSERLEILNLFEKVLVSKKDSSSKLHISSHDYEFEGVAVLTPFTSFLGFTYAYLLEISDYTEPLLTDRGKVWGATLQRIAHEIKTPLSTIILSLDNIRYRIGSKDKNLNEEIYRMQGELERIKELTKNFMLFANVEKNKQSLLSLNDVLKTSANKFKSYTNHNINLLLPENDFKIIGDFNQLLQMFSLCIENSIDACKERGIIKINSEIAENDFIKVTISDDGIGIDKDTLQKVFEPYYSTKKDGTGMGLSLVKKIIEDHSGRIIISSTLDLGTDIIIHLKRAK